MTRSPRARALAAGLVVVLAALAVAAESATRVYKARSRTAEELLPLAQTAIAGEGSAVMDRGTNSIVLLGEARAVAATIELLEQQDRARRSLVIRVDSHQTHALDAAGYRIDWSASAGSFRVGNVRFPGEGSEVDVRLNDLAASRGSSFSSVVRVLDGEAGRIATGRSVPVRTHSRYGTTTTLVEAESGLEVRPRILSDDRVQLELQPFEGDVDDAGRVAFRDAATVVVVKPGETVAVGGLARRDAAVAQSVLSGRAHEESVEESVLLLHLTVD